MAGNISVNASVKGIAPRAGTALASGAGVARPAIGGAKNYYVSPYDQNLAKGNPTFSSGLDRYKGDYYKAYESGDKDGMRLANSALENLRLMNGGYLGGSAGSDFDVRNPYTNVNANAALMQRGNEDLARQMYASLVAQGTQRIEGQREGIGRSYDDAARQAYVLSEQQKTAMPQQMQALGMTGGASESAALRQGASYQNNVNQITTQRQGAMTELDNAIRELQASGDVQTAQYLLGSAEKMADRHLDAANMDIGRHDTLNAQNTANAYQLAGLTGMYNGAPTLQKQQMDYNRGMELFSYGVPAASVARELNITKEQAAYMQQMWQQMQAAGGARGGGRGRSSGGGGGGDDDVGSLPATEQTFAQRADSAANAGLQWLTRFMPSPLAAALGGQSAFSHRANMMTQNEWAQHKNAKGDTSGARNYASYADYVADYKSYYGL